MAKRRNSRRVGFGKCPISWKELDYMHLTFVKHITVYVVLRKYFLVIPGEMFAADCRVTAWNNRNLPSYIFSLLTFVSRSKQLTLLTKHLLDYVYRIC